MSKNIGELLMGLQAISVHDANRVRRLLNCGCPKKTIAEICETVASEMREPMLSTEELKRYLLPLAPLSPFN